MQRTPAAEWLEPKGGRRYSPQGGFQLNNNNNNNNNAIAREQNFGLGNMRGTKRFPDGRGGGQKTNKLFDVLLMCVSFVSKNLETVFCVHF